MALSKSSMEESRFPGGFGKASFHAALEELF
jgi:hypothetical protein